jgi:hypothetical protein
MTEDPGVGKKGLSPFKRMQIRAADADTPNTNQGFMGCRHRKFRIFDRHVIGCFAYGDFHSSHLSFQVTREAGSIVTKLYPKQPTKN